MFIENLKRVTEKYIHKPSHVDQVHLLLDERFKHLGLTDQQISTFGVEFLISQMGDGPIRNLKMARSMAKEKAQEFKLSIVDVLSDSESSQLFKEKLQGTLAYGALEITRRIINNPDLSYRKKKRQLVFLETFLDQNGIPSEHSKFLVKEGKKEVKKQEVVKNIVTGAKFIFGMAMGVLGAETAEKYVSFIPAAQEALGLAIVVGTSVSRLTTKLMSEKSPGWKKMDKALAKIQPILTGIGIGLMGHGVYEQTVQATTVIGGQVHGEIYQSQVSDLTTTPVETTQPLMTDVHDVVTGNPTETIKYVVSGSENGGFTDIAYTFYSDPYGQQTTDLIIQNKDILTNPSREGYDSASKLIEFLQNNPTYTWRDAMNESARNGHATEVSKLFTDALKIIRPGTVFNVPVQ